MTTVRSVLTPPFVWTVFSLNLLVTWYMNLGPLKSNGILGGKFSVHHCVPVYM